MSPRTTRPAVPVEDMYEVLLARPTDLGWLAAIELAAARLLEGLAPESVLTETTSQRELAEAQRDGRLWVALAEGRPVGFALVELLEPTAAHLHEIDVHPDHARRGLGKRLVTAVCEWAEGRGFRSVTLTTFRDAAWNMPFYARLGFEEIRGNQLSRALELVVQDETRRGLDPGRRVVMRRVATGGGGAA